MSRPIILATLLISLAHAHAQSNAGAMLEDALKKALTGLTPIPEKERDEVIAAVRPLLEKRLTFRPDGVASAVHHLNGEAIYVEWIGLKAAALRKDSLTPADSANGITRRYRLTMTCSSHRTWKPTSKRWSEWFSTGYPLFPSGITIEERNGSLSATLAERGTFLPGPERSIGAPAPAPAQRDQGLPAGMQRVK